MSKEHKLVALADVLKLSQDEFERFLPDFVAWFLMFKSLPDGVESEALNWVDDGRPGEIHSVTLTTKETGHVEVIKGTAWTEAA